MRDCAEKFRRVSCRSRARTFLLILDNRDLTRRLQFKVTVGTACGREYHADIFFNAKKPYTVEDFLKILPLSVKSISTFIFTSEVADTKMYAYEVHNVRCSLFIEKKKRKKGN